MTLQKTESFQPLTSVATADKNREFRVTVIPQAEPAQNFKSLSQNPPTGHTIGAASGKKACEPRLSLEHDGGRISNIRILCSCGQVMELACVYEESPKTK